jgi:hypothetical protein
MIRTVLKVGFGTSLRQNGTSSDLKLLVRFLKEPVPKVVPDTPPTLSNSVGDDLGGRGPSLCSSHVEPDIVGRSLRAIALMRLYCFSSGSSC